MPRTFLFNTGETHWSDGVVEYWGKEMSHARSSFCSRLLVDCDYAPGSTMRSRLKYIVAGLLLCVALVVLFLFFALRGPAPLPFSTGGFVSTSKIRVMPPNPSLAQRVEHLIMTIEEHLSGSNAYSVSAVPAAKWGVQSLLNLLTDFSGTRYLMSAELAAGTVSFGTTNAMNGPQFTTAIENTVCHSNVNWWDSSRKGWRAEQLELLRFPEQKMILVLPKSDVADFLRTNKIDPRRFGKALE